MSTKIKLVTVPAELLPFIGEKVGESRFYRKEGPEEEVGLWFDKLCEYFDKLISPGGASMFAPVGRAAVHKRLKEGNLTGFFYYPTTMRRSIFGKVRQKREKPYGYILVEEVKAWAAEIQEQSVRLGYSLPQVEKGKPDHDGDFTDWDSKWAKGQGKKSKLKGGK